MSSSCWPRTRNIITNTPRLAKREMRNVIGRSASFWSVCMASRDIAATADSIGLRRPALKTILAALVPLLEARRDVAAELAVPPLPAFERKRAESGESILAGFDFEKIAPAMSAAWKKLEPLLTAHKMIGAHRDALNAFFDPEEGADYQGRLAFAMLDSPDAMRQIAKDCGIGAEILDFVGNFVVAAVLRAMTSSVSADWDEAGAWREGYCPVCGSYPVIAWFDRASHDERNAFLSGGGGKKHFHCGFCGANWIFRRGTCPSCASDAAGVMEMLSEAGFRGERLDFCSKCKAYCPSVDLRELADIPDMDAMALGMIHFDLLAAQKKLRPLRPMFWNRF